MKKENGYAKLTEKELNHMVYNNSLSLDQRKSLLKEFISTMGGQPQNILRLQESLEKINTYDKFCQFIYNIYLSQDKSTSMSHVVEYNTGVGKSFKQNRKEYFESQKYKR